MVSATIRLEDARVGIPTSSFGTPTWPVQKIDDSWSMTMDDDKFNQGVTPIAAVPDVIPLLEQINTPPDTSYTAITDLATDGFFFPFS